MKRYSKLLVLLFLTISQLALSVGGGMFLYRYNKYDGTNDLDPRFSPSEAEVIFVNTSNDGISQRNIFTQNVHKDTGIGGNDYNREELFTKTIMPDWE